MRGTGVRGARALGRPVRPPGRAAFEITEQTRNALTAWIRRGSLTGDDSPLIGAVALADLEADNLAAEQIQDRVQIEPASDQCGRKVRHVPAPHLPRSRGDVRARRADTVGCLGAASRPGLSVSPQYTAEARFTGDVDAFVRERRHDARWREFRKTRFVRDLQDPLAFLLAQRMVRH